MYHRRNRMIRGLTIVTPLFVLASGVGLWRSSRTAAAQSQSGSNAVVTVAAGQRLGDDPGQKGTTYYALEAQSSRFVSHFADGSRAVAERTIDGDISTVLTDAQGSEHGRFRVHGTAAAGVALIYSPAAEAPVIAKADPSVRATLDWANRQLFTLNRDGVGGHTGLVWQDGLMRRAGAGGAVDDRALKVVETVWTNGLTARTTRVHPSKDFAVAGRRIEGEILVTEVQRDGVVVGQANYMTRERIFTFKVDGGRGTLIAPEHLKEKYGGWPFTPDMTWMNLQTLALYQWQASINERSFVADAGGCRERPTMIGKLLQAVAPVVNANEPGCDGLHWLDGTVYRYCCDVHDYCYSKNGCSSSSWWQFWSGWRCDACNTWVIGCFLDSGFEGPFHMFW